MCSLTSVEHDLRKRAQHYAVRFFPLGFVYLFIWKKIIFACDCVDNYSSTRRFDNNGKYSTEN